MDEDMEGKTHTERERERDRDRERDRQRENTEWFGTTLSRQQQQQQRERERERERDIEHPKESGVGSRSHHPPALGSPSFLAEGLGKDPIPHSVLRIKSDRVY